MSSAIASIAQYQCQATELALQFRSDSHTQAALDLATMVAQLVQTFSTQPAQYAAELQNILQAVLNCQAQRDWLGLADYLEYELQDLLHLCS
ncbi:MAG TPA: hypothetical protein VIN66_13910 [Rheinheimera sp.]|uniref:hypothetical protein n=1 Tax=Rheinheimera sp. TaxID=1869214 RepID=UPI002F91C070